MAELTDAKRRIIERLKHVESATAPELAVSFGLTDTAVRQHLDALEQTGLVESMASAPSGGRGRPPLAWRLSGLAHDLFPDRHAELTVELLASIRDALGDDGLDKVIGARARVQRQAYERALPPPGASLAERVVRLAEIRTAEGYLAESVANADGTMLLVEHHCPIADAARTCSGFCQSELELFKSVLGEDVVVERTQHLLNGDQRCAYRIRPVGEPPAESPARPRLKVRSA